MSLATKVGTIIGTAAAYVVHYTNNVATLLIIVGVLYANKEDIQKFAVKHSLNKSSPDAIQDNLLECLEYMD